MQLDTEIRRPRVDGDVDAQLPSKLAFVGIGRRRNDATGALSLSELHRDSSYTARAGVPAHALAGHQVGRGT